MSHKHAIVFGLLTGVVLGYVFADKLAPYPPFKQVVAAI